MSVKGRLKTDGTFMVDGELVESGTEIKLYSDGDLYSPEFIEGTSFKTNADGTVEAYEFIEGFPEPILRNILVGDDLSGKTLYLSFPNDLYASLEEGFITIFETDETEDMYSYKFGENDGSVHRTDGYPYYIYDEGVIWNDSESEEGDYSGVVTSIDNTHPAYQYIKIEVEE